MNEHALQISQPLVPLVDEFAGRLFGELDYIQEGQSCEKFARLYAHVPRVRTPGIYWSATARRSGTRCSSAAESFAVMSVTFACILMTFLLNKIIQGDWHDLMQVLLFELLTVTHCLFLQGSVHGLVSCAMLLVSWKDVKSRTAARLFRESFSEGR